ncbi:MAG TPA: hypothetical protein VGJ53_16505 [Micromonosporaceae bacterium]
MAGVQPTIIDLGVLDRADAARAADEAAWLGRAESRRPWRFLRRLLIGVTLGITLAAVTAAAPISRGLIPTLATPLGGNGEMVVGDHAVYALTWHPNRTELVAYRLADGSRQWAVPTGATRLEGNVGVLVFGDVVVVTEWGSTSGPGEPGAWSTAFDAHDGARLWRRDGVVNGTAAGGRLVMTHEFPRPLGARGWGMDIELVEPRTARQIWSLQLDQDGYRQYSIDWISRPGQEHTRLVTLTGSGRLRSYDLATGKMIAERPMPTLDTLSQLNPTNGVVLLSQDSDPTLVMAYGVDDLAWRWDARVLRDWMTGVACGPFICLPTDAGLRAVDPVTGENAWVRPDLLIANDLGPPWPRATGTALRQDRETTDLIDVRTGRTIVSLGRWTPLRQGRGTAYLMSEPQPPPENRSVWLGRYRPEFGAVERLGVLPEVMYCENSGDYVVCHTFRHEVRAWRLRT